MSFCEQCKWGKYCQFESSLKAAHDSDTTTIKKGGSPYELSIFLAQYSPQFGCCADFNSLVKKYSAINNQQAKK